MLNKNLTGGQEFKEGGLLGWQIRSVTFFDRGFICAFQVSQDMQCTCNVKSKRVRQTIVGVEEQ